VEFDDLHSLRGVDSESDAGEAAPELIGEPLRGAGIAPNPVTELVADLLETTGLIPSDRLSQARSRAGTGSLAQALVEEGIVPTSGLARALATTHHLPFVDLGVEGIDKTALESIPTHVLERAAAIPYRIEGNVLKIAIADPTNVQTIDELRLATRYRLEVGVAPREDIELELRKKVRATEVWERAALVEDELEVEEAEDEDDLEADDGVSDAPLVRLVNSIILQAAEDGASDVHFDQHDDALVVRLRVDGVLHEVQRIPKRLAMAVTTRLKVLAKLDIAERRKPQDGRISLSAKAAGRTLDIRVAVLPTVEGEGIVMRLLDKSKRPPTLEELGLSDDMRAQLEEIVLKPTGALLVTGPTGSGKSTTLYASLAEINRPEINIITVEDPVEYRLAGLNQVQVNPRAGLTFASALRSILRSDPDVVMVGEIRDVETAKMAIEAALTGHFVLSTLHTNDAPAALTRLNEMGVEPFLTGAAVTAVLAQRLARKLCTHCCEMYIPTREELLNARFSPEQVAAADGVSLYRKRGCPRCNQSGYKGRIGIYQLMVMNEELGALAARHASREELEREAMSSGMKTLWDDGLARAASGMTSLEELGRVLI
jgi:type IV pilus assembly protein PilB